MHETTKRRENSSDVSIKIQSIEMLEWEIAALKTHNFDENVHWIIGHTVSGGYSTQTRITSLRQRPFIHIECFIKKEVITVYFIHNYLWGYKPINREHLSFWQACPLHNAKKKQEEGKEGDKNKTKDGLFQNKKK